MGCVFLCVVKSLLVLGEGHLGVGGPLLFLGGKGDEGEALRRLFLLKFWGVYPRDKMVGRGVRLVQCGVKPSMAWAFRKVVAF